MGRSRAPPVDKRFPVWRALPWAVTMALGLGSLVTLVVWAPWNVSPRAVPMRLSASVGADVSLDTDPGASLAFSPNGGVLAFVARNQQSTGRQPLALRATARPAAGVGRARNRGRHEPVLLPIGQWIAFFADGKLKKVAVGGGHSVTLCNAPSPRGGSWAEDGTITFMPMTGLAGLLRVSSAGGKPEPLTTLADGEATQRWPRVAARRQGGALHESHRLDGLRRREPCAQPLPSGDRKIVQRRGYHGRYLASGHLVFVQDRTLFAAPFDSDRLELTG